MSTTNKLKDASFSPILPNFWSIIKKGKTTNIIIHVEKLIDFCSKIGYYNFIDYTGNSVLVRKVDNILHEARIEEVKQSIKNYLRNGVKLENVWAEFAKRNLITENFIHLIEKLPPSNFNISKKSEAFFFYQNGVVCIYDLGVKLIPYAEFNGIVWEQQIIKRDFIGCGLEYQNSVFNKFLHNVCNNEDKRYQSLLSILGYSLHPFKDPTFTKAMIFVDEKIDFSGEAHGGTGKSLIAKALEKITPMVIKDGKYFNSNETFVYDDIRPYHNIVYFDDVKLTFNLENFYSFISTGVKVNRKYKDSVYIPFSSSPKLIISSNYMVRGTGGETDERRRIEFEIAPYYSNRYTPFNEFKHIFFEDWDTQEWQLFDNLMMRSVHYFIKNGVIDPPKINLKENKLILDTDPEFVAFMDNNIVKGTKYDKAALIDVFRKVAPSNRNLSGIKFKKWVDNWAVARNINVTHLKSNGKSYVIFTNPNEDNDLAGGDSENEEYQSGI